MKTIIEFNGKQIELGEYKNAEGEMVYSLFMAQDARNPRTFSLTKEQVDVIEIIGLLLKGIKTHE